MASKNAATEALMGQLHAAMVTNITTKVLAGTATAAEMAVAAKMLKDSNITAAIDANNAMGKMSDALSRSRAPADPVGQKTLDAALDAVVSMEEYRNGTR